MHACTYLNVAAGMILFGISSFTACGESQPPAKSPETAPSEATPAAATADMPPASTGQPPPAVATPTGTSLAASPPASTASGPDRTLDDIRAVVASNRDSFRACYDRSLKGHPGIKGTFVLKFVVNPDGTVKSAEADQAKSQIHASDLDTCAIAALKGLKFPPSRKGMESTVSYPFDFNPKGPQLGAPPK
ncbi:MAG TPA: TonB family protein [Polyangiaceae bacterium]